MLINPIDISKREIITVYVYFDGEMLFSCKVGDEQFIAVVSSDNDTLYAPVSHERLKQIESGEVDLNSAFKQTECGSVIKYTEIKNICYAGWVKCDSLKANELPDPGATLKF